MLTKKLSHTTLIKRKTRGIEKLIAIISIMTEKATKAEDLETNRIEIEMVEVEMMRDITPKTMPLLSKFPSEKTRVHLNLLHQSPSVTLNQQIVITRELQLVIV